MGLCGLRGERKRALQRPHSEPVRPVKRAEKREFWLERMQKSKPLNGCGFQGIKTPKKVWSIAGRGGQKNLEPGAQSTSGGKDAGACVGHLKKKKLVGLTIIRGESNPKGLK